MKYLPLFFLNFWLFLWGIPTFAVPKEIILIRHADKLEQTDPGPFLSPIGQVRAIKFAFYFLKNFGEPDVIIAKDPDTHQGKSTAIRELQTIAPLSNLLAEQHPDKIIPVLHPFTKKNYDALARRVLTHPAFNHKIVLICWDHAYIPDLARHLGVTQPLKKWHSKTYDTIYDIQYDALGHVSHFEAKEHQYPVSFKGSWETLNHQLS